jgi:hypothetical protein
VEDFKALIRDTLPIKNPDGTWQYGRNMLLSKGFKSVTNEDGFALEYMVAGTVIGFITTNSEIVYFSKNSDGTDEIGLVRRTGSATPTYTTVIKSSLFNFQYDAPIEGIFSYNFKGELIVAWSDGVHEDSNRPYVVNLNNLPLALNTDKTLVDNTEFTKLYMFPNKTEGNLTITTREGLTLGYSAVYLTFKYVLEDITSDDLPNFSVGKLVNLTYNNIGFNTATTATSIFYNPVLSFTNLDANYSRIKIVGVFKKTDGTLETFESISLPYVSQTLNFTLDSLDAFTSISTDSILVESIIFQKVHTLTKQENQVHLGNTRLRPSIQFQKYASLLNLTPTKSFIDREATINIPSLMPDEVYAFYIELQYLDGSYSNAFHISGDAATGSDLSDVTSTQVTDYGLTWLSDLGTGVKQFHLFNQGFITSNTDSKFGHWSNLETYPNTADYNSLVDYNGVAITGGVDNRNQPIRYHRVPNILNSDEFTFGDPYTSGDRLNVDATKFVTFPNTDRHIIGVKVNNFQTVVPASIISQIQGYRISFVRRNQSNNYVIGNPTIARQRSFLGGQDGEQRFTYTQLIASGGTDNLDFDNIRVYATEIIKDDPTLSPSFVFNNFSYISVQATGIYSKLDNINKYRDITAALSYVPSNNAAAGTQYREEGVTTRLGSVIDIEANTANNLGVQSVLNSFIYSFKLDLYQGFRSNQLVIMDRTTNLTSAQEIDGGDVYMSALLNFLVGQVVVNSGTLTQTSAILNAYHNYSPYNDLFVSTTATTAGFTPILQLFPIPTEGIENFSIDTRIVGQTSTNINNIATILTDNFVEESITEFPYRIQRGLKIATESLSTRAFRNFLVNDYYEMPNDKGRIVALRSSGRKLYIQMKFALFVATIKDTLRTGNVEAFLGQSDLFAYAPQEIFADSEGYIGSSSKFACIVVKGIYITVDQSTGQIFLIKDTIDEISNDGVKNWFRNNWDIGFDYTKTSDLGEVERVDNPYMSVGHLVGYDKEYSRLLFTKKLFTFIRPELLVDTLPLTERVIFDGEFYTLNGTRLEFTDATYFTNESQTFSYNMELKKWAFEHDYFPNLIFNTHDELYSVTNTLTGTTRANVYRHNDKIAKGFYYGQRFESYIDLIFNQRLNLTKLYQSLMWVTSAINTDGSTNQFKTIDKIMIYNETQCSGVIDLNVTGFNPVRNRNNEWHFNNFRDLVINASSPIIDDNGDVVITNINNNKIWFDKSNFISKFITVRLIISNVTNEAVYIHKLNVKSVINK